MHLCCNYLSLPIMSFKSNLDNWGIVTSIVCAIHCAVIPLVITVIPFLNIHIIQTALFEWSMILVAGIIGMFAMRHGYNHHHNRLLPGLLFFSGLICLVTKQFIASMEFGFLALAVLQIILAHIINFHFCKRSKKALFNTSSVKNSISSGNTIQAV